jgi:hypothetical protein
MHLRDPSKGYTALEWAEFCGRRQCVDVIRSYAKPMSRGKRLSQAWSDTESWLKSLKLGGHNNNSNCNSDSPSNSPDVLTSSVNLLAKTSAASLMCTSVPLLNASLEGDNPDQRKTRSLIIPSIHIICPDNPEETTFAF